jgi:serine/threonine-protein kinase
VTRTSFPNLSYLAPEEARGGATAVDAAVDVFSVGAILHALLTGHRVNHGPTEVESLVLAATRPVPPVERLDPALPKALAAIVDRALQWDPRKRYASALKMREALARVPTDR